MLLLATRGQGQNSKPTLVNGVASYVENGQRKEINVGKKCADLWVSPDGAVVAFIGIDKAERGDFIVESSVYIAKKVDRFKPQAIPVKPFTLHGRSWSVVRSPSLSPDLKTLYFLVPEFAAGATLMQMNLPRGTPQSIRDAAGYAVIWNGKDSGDLLLQVRDHNKE